MISHCKVCGEEYFANTRNADGVHFHNEFGVCSLKCWQKKRDDSLQREYGDLDKGKTPRMKSCGDD